jgi:hypothetical protein
METQSWLTYHDFNPSTNAFTMPDLPPSLLAAAENHQIMPHYASIAHGDCWELTAEDDDARDRAAAMTPSSYHHRMLQMSLPQMQYDVERWSYHTSCELTSLHRVDSAIGSFDIPDFVETVDLTDFEFERENHEASFPAVRVSPEADGDEREEDNYCQATPLQYHLIQMRSRAELKENPAPATSSHNSCEVALPSTQKYVTS